METIENEEEDRLIKVRSPLKVRNWEIRASAAVDGREEYGRGLKKYEWRGVRECMEREKEEKYNKIIKKLSEK